MAIKVWSTTLPRTTLSPMSPAGLLFTGAASLIGADDNDDFVTTYTPALWTQALSNATLTAGVGSNPLVVTLAPTGTPATWSIEHSTSFALPLSFDTGMDVAAADLSLDGEHKLLTVNITTGGSDNLDIEIVRDDTGPTRNVVVTWDDGVGGSGSDTIDYGSDSMSLRVVLANATASLWDNKTQKCIWSAGYDISNPVTVTIGGEAPAGASSWQVRPKPFTTLPTISLWDRRGSKTPYVTQVDAGEIRCSWQAGYPGSHTPTVWGCGLTQGVSEVSSNPIVSQDFHITEANVNLMASNVEQLYDDSGGVLACRNFAIVGNGNKKDIIAPMECFDDGSALDGSVTTVYTDKPGDLKRSRLGVLLRDENNTVWGESFRFDRILTPTADLKLAQEYSTDRVYESCRLLHMSNGDRCYYGIAGAVGGPAPEPWTPLELGNLFAWWDPADATLSGSNITEIPDKAATGPSLLQHGAGPLVTTINGVTAVDSVNSASDYLRADGAIDTVVEVYTVMQNGAGDTAWIAAQDGTTSIYYGAAQSGSAATPQNNAGTPTYEIDGTDLSSPTRDDLYTAGIGIHLLGVRGIDATSWTNIRPFYYGGGGGFQHEGAYGDHILVTSALSLEDRQRVQGYLAHKYGTESQLPVDHPYKDSPPTIAGGVVNGSVYVELVDNPGSGSWEIVKLEADFGAETVVDTGLFSGGDPVIDMTGQEGFFVFRGTAGESFSANIRFGAEITDPIAESSVTDGEVDPAFSVTSIQFAYKTHKSGYPYIIYHDVSEGTVELVEMTAASASTRNASISAFEKEGDVVVVWQDLPSGFGWMEDSNQSLSYSLFSVSGMEFGAEKTILLPRSLDTDAVIPTGASPYTIRSFDVVKTDTSINLVFSAQLRVESLNCRTLSGQAFTLEVDRAPVLSDGFYVASWPANLFTFDGVTSVNINDVDVVRVDCSSYATMFEFRVPDYSGITPSMYRIARAEIDFIKAEYDPDTDKVVVTLVDFFHRLPMVFMGKDRQWSEAAIPFTKEIVQYLLEDNQGSAITKFDWFGIDSAHTVLGYDGMLYCVTSRLGGVDRNLALNIISPELYWSARERYIERGELFGSTDPTVLQNFDIYSGKYKQDTMSMYANYGVDIATRNISIARVNQHTVFGVAGFATPSIFQNIEYDVYPFATSEEDVWIPEYGDLGLQYWTDSAAGVTFDSYYAELVEVEEPLNATFGKTLTAVNTNAYSLTPQYEAGYEGYKFHVRAEIGIGTTTLGTMPSGAHYITARAVAVSEEGARWGVRARFIAGDATNPTDLVCQIYSAKSMGWVTVKTFEDYLVTPEPVDYFITCKIYDQGANSAPSAKIMFSYKRRQGTVYDGVSYLEKYTSEGEWFVADAKCEALTTETSSWILYGATYPALGSTSNNKARIYQMGWNILNIDDAFVYANPKGSWAGSVFSGDYFRTQFPGGSFRNLNDTPLLSRSSSDVYQGQEVSGPFYPLRPSNANISGGTTPKMHWHNGFRFRLSGETAAVGDEWLLSRESVANTNWLMSKRMHGNWRTNTDNADVHIWADAQDSAMDKFYVNVFMVLGSNVQGVVLVGRDSDLDPWTELGTLNMKVYDIDYPVHGSASGERVRVTSGSDFLIGTGREPLSLYYHQDGKRDSKVVNCKEDEVYIDTLSVYDDAVSSSMFTTKGVCVLDEPVRYRFIGIKIPSTSTYEGYFKMHTVDFGYVSTVPLQYHYSSESQIQLAIDGESLMVFDEVSVSRRKITAYNEYSLEYKILDRLTYQKFLAAIDKVSMNRRPLWLLEAHDHHPSLLLDLCVINDKPTHSLIVDENGDEYYTLTFRARSVK